MATVTKTIGTGGVFTTLQAWADDISTNGNGFYSSGDIAVGEVLNDLSGTGSLLSFNAPDATNPIAQAILRPDTGLAHDGVFGGGITLTKTDGSGNLINVNTGVTYDVEIRDLELYCNVTAGSFNAGRCLANYSWNNIDVVVKRCILRNSQYSASTGAPYGVYGNARVKVIRSIVADFKNSTTGAGTGVHNCRTVENCSVDNCFTGVANTNVTTEAYNTIVGRCSTACYSGTFSVSSDTNMSTDATAPGTTNYRNETATSIWTDPDNDDYTLQTGTNAIANGTDLGAAYDQNIDIENDTITGNWDLGAYDLLGSPTTTTTTAAPTTTTAAPTTTTAGPTTTTTAGPTTTTTTAAPTTTTTTTTTTAAPTTTTTTAAPTTTTTAAPPSQVAYGCTEFVGMRPQSSTAYPVVFFMRDATDHETGETGKSPTMYLWKNGVYAGSANGTITELQGGLYSFTGDATDRNTVGTLDMYATAAGCDGWRGRMLITTDDFFASQFSAIKGSNFNTNNHALDKVATIAEVWARAGSAMASVPSGTSSIEAKINAIYHKLFSGARTNKTTGKTYIRNEGDTANVAEADVSDDGTTFIRSSYSDS